MGFETRLLARDPARPNLIAHLNGSGKAPPLLLYGHVDVVTTEGRGGDILLSRAGCLMAVFGVGVRSMIRVV